LHTEQNIFHFEINPDETPKTIVIYIGKEYICIQTLWKSLLIDNIVHSIATLCVCNSSMIIGCGFNFSAPIITHEDLSFDYMLYHELQPTPIGMNPTSVRKRLQHMT